MAFLAFVLAIVLGGVWASPWLWKRTWPDVLNEPLSSSERQVSAIWLGLCLWLAGSWLLAITHQLTSMTTGTLALAMSLAGAARFGVWRKTAAPAAPRTRPEALALGLVVTFLGLWLVELLLRSLLVPVYNSDGLSYHLPKAALLVQRSGYSYLETPDTRVGSGPANYELLLAEQMLLRGDDLTTAWIGPLFLALLWVATYALVLRWWGSRLAALAVVLGTCTVPLIVLHGGAHKNDLMFAFLAMGTLLWLGRWTRHGEQPALILVLLGWALAVGTKLHGGLLVLVCLPGIWAGLQTARRRGLKLKARQVLGMLALGMGAFVVLGGVPYLTSLWHTGAPQPQAETAIQGGRTYGDWLNLLEYPFLLFGRPLLTKDGKIWVFWEGRYWFWPSFDLYWSDYGLLTTVALLSAPVGLWALRRMQPSQPFTPEPMVLFAGFGLFFLIAPIILRPLGWFGSFGRYTLYLPGLILAGSLAPALRFLEQRMLWVAGAVTAGVGFVAAYSIFTYTVHDVYAPLDYLEAQHAHPSRTPHIEARRACTALDRRAGPNDTVWIDSAFDGWIYPCFGKALTRSLTFISGESATIPDSADWVVIDRAFHIYWGHPDFKTMGDYWTDGSYGKPSAEELLLYQRLLLDPRFELVFRFEGLNQAIFRNRSFAARRQKERQAQPQPPVLP